METRPLSPLSPLRLYVRDVVSIRSWARPAARPDLRARRAAQNHLAAHIEARLTQVVLRLLYGTSIVFERISKRTGSHLCKFVSSAIFHAGLKVGDLAFRRLELRLEFANALCQLYRADRDVK